MILNKENNSLKIFCNHIKYSLNGSQICCRSPLTPLRYEIRLGVGKMVNYLVPNTSDGLLRDGVMRLNSLDCYVAVSEIR